MDQENEANLDRVCRSLDLSLSYRFLVSRPAFKYRNP